MPDVTALRPGRRGQVLVELDGREWRRLPAEVALRAGLAPGVSLDRARVRELRRELRRSEALTVATRALRTRDLTASRLAERLERSGVAPAVRARVLETLAQAGIVDDERFAHGRARTLAERGAGDAAIRHELGRQGLGRELVEAALGELPPEAQRAERAVGRRRGPQAARYLARKGFSEDSVEAAMGPAVADDPGSGLR